MKKRKNLATTSILTILILILSLTVVYAQSEYIPGISSCSIYYSSGYIEFRASLNSGVSASLIRNMQVTGDYYHGGTYLTSLSTSDSGNVSSKNLTYVRLPAPGFYNMDSFGWYTTTTMPNLMFYSDSRTEYTHYSSLKTQDEDKLREELNSFFDVLNNHIAESLNINLNDYKKIDLFDSDDFEGKFDLLNIFFNVPKETGDFKPSIYLNDNGKGIILIQKHDGTNIAYYLEHTSEGWVIQSEERAAGTMMKFQSDLLPELNDVVLDDYAAVEYHYVVDIEADENNKVSSKNFSVEGINKAMDQFQENLLQHIASSLDISLEDYTEVKTNLSSYGPSLVILYFELPKEVGDFKPTIFLKNDNDKEGIILTQKSDGRNIAYNIELLDEGWTIVETKSAQGIRMTINFE